MLSQRVLIGRGLDLGKEGSGKEEEFTFGVRLFSFEDTLGKKKGSLG